MLTLDFTFVVAYSRNRVIGRDNALPWRLPKDLQRFKDLTMGKPLLMGHNTYRSIGRPLPGRRMIVLSRDLDCHIDSCEVIHCLSQLPQIINPHEEIMVAGGGQIFQLLLPHAQRVHATEVQAEIDGDVYFPELDQNEWVEVSRDTHPAQKEGEYDYAFVEFVRK